MNNTKKLLKAKVSEMQGEARGNLKIIGEIAGLERYISETYVSRVFYELIQNADDCGSTKFIAKKFDKNLFFLNDGSPFTCEDLEAICRSAFSTKQRGSNIGYRGIGFKSTTGASDCISIYSGELEISFSRKKTQELFESEMNVPLLRVPHWGIADQATKEKSEQLLSEYSCTTCFVLHDVNEDQLLQDMKGIKANAITFLKSITNITIGITSECYITVTRRTEGVSRRRNEAPYQDLEIEFKSVIGKKVYDDLQLVRIWQYKSIDIASEIEDGVPKRLSRNKAYAQAFLPMLTVTGLGAVVNGDFSTDPSRTRIAVDDHTKSIMEDLLGLINGLLRKHSQGNLSQSDSQLLELIIPYHRADVLDISPSIIANSIKSASLDTGVDYSSFLIKPSWMSLDDYKDFCRNHDKKEIIFDQISAQDSYYFFKSIGASEVSIMMLIDWISKTALSLQSTMNLVRYVNDDIRELKRFQAIEASYLKHAKLVICENRGIHSAEEINNDHSLVVDKFAFDSISNFCGGLGAIDWHLMLGLDPLRFPKEVVLKSYKLMLKKNDSIYSTLLAMVQDQHRNQNVNLSSESLKSADILKVSSSLFRDDPESIATAQPAWRKAELMAIDILDSLGIEAKDVSKRNCGCDLIGREKVNREKEIYIEVKLLESIGSEFRITDNEIYAANDRAEAYWMILIVQPDKKQPPTHFSLITNAFEVITRSVERRCVKYESFCSDYDADFRLIYFN